MILFLKRFKRLLLTFGLLALLIHPVYAGADDEAYALGFKAAKSGQTDFAFMYYRSILNDYPASTHREDALFAIGEYQFLLPNHREAEAIFNTFIERYPDSKGKLFALAYLLKIAKMEKNESLAQDLEKKILSLSKVSLVFRNYKQYQYHSALWREHKAIVHIDKIEFFIRGKPFVDITY